MRNSFSGSSASSLSLSRQMSAFLLPIGCSAIEAISWTTLRRVCSEGSSSSSIIRAKYEYSKIFGGGGWVRHSIGRSVRWMFFLVLTWFLASFLWARDARHIEAASLTSLTESSSRLQSGSTQLSSISFTFPISRKLIDVKFFALSCLICW